MLANAALRIRARDPSSSVLDAVDAEVEAQLLRASAGAPSGSLATWLATSHRGELAVVRAEAANWATQVVEAAATLTSPWTIAPSDAYYDVARARTTLRGRRDVIVAAHSARVLLRVRAGAPGPSAGAGLRADLAIDALAHPEGHGALRILGLWPEAGVVLAVDGTIEDLRAGARALLRTAALRSCAQCEMAA